MCESGYQELLSSEIPEATQNGTTVRIIAGTSCGREAKVRTRTPAYFLDIKMEPERSFEQELPETFKGFAYVLKGNGLFGAKETKGQEAECLLLSEGGSLTVKTGEDGLHFVLIAGQPLGEPVARQGPFVMNTQEELMRCFVDYQRGEF